MVFGRFPAGLGPETPLNGSGSKNDAERTQNYPRRLIRRPCRDHFDMFRELNSGLNRKLKYRLKLWSVFGLLPAKLGPRTPLNGPGSKNGAERTDNQPRR